MPRLKVGDRAPDFSIRSSEGSIVKLSEMLGRGSVVLYFYPRDGTPGCTAEAKAFRDAYGDFRRVGAEVVGVSSDSSESHRTFAADCSLTFTLLSDSDGAVRESYGAGSMIGVFGGRVTYVIDRDGIVRHVFSSQLRPRKHVKEALDAASRLGA